MSQSRRRSRCYWRAERDGLRFAAVWLLVASVTFVFFRWGPRSRYLCLPAMAFSLLVSDGML
ncbi:MAG: hypothetical protein DMG01_29500, partial [Acidobacteria bacterium]